ncbi:MAG: bifunctional folylpolyglutamate synthase/dihydrofolate synthase [Chloroflexi bacterium]|nr:bifunctional folylpolyglutamate synthase/dihydrofolate synthase [Chloroflexota bacterium]
MPAFSYNDALDALYGFINYEVQRQDRYSPSVMTLDRPRALLDRLGNPQQRYPKIHLTGTKGKGSVGAMTAAMLQASGYRVGLYSSPHLQDFRERFQINGQMIPAQEVANLVEELLPHFHAIEGLTWFEITTALAFEYFAREQVDIAVIEVGLGGRLDATNVIIPHLTIITSLSFDHTHLLGNSLESIAREKGGIIKPGIPVISAPQPPEALAVLDEIAAAQGVTLTVIGRDRRFKAEPENLTGQQVTLYSDDQAITYASALLGQHQAINTAVAVTAIHQLQSSGIPVSEAAIHQGLESVKWPGRLEIAQLAPPVILDAAHNRASARCLSIALRNLFPQRSLILVFGAKGDKDIAGMMDELLPEVSHLVITQAIDSRAESPDEIVRLARETGYAGPISVQPIVDDAVDLARRLAEDHGLVCVSGSLYVVGEARSSLGLAPGQAVTLAPSSQEGDYHGE